MGDEMPDKNVREAVERSTVKDGNIRIAVSDPGLAGKVKADIRGINEKIYWYIRFNIVLDPETVSSRTMSVMETNGYILDTEISYDPEKNRIILNPVDNYQEDIFYILKIRRKVRSAGGNNLKREINILFKLKDNQISEYKILEPSVKVAKPRKKPKRLKTPKIQATASPVPIAPSPGREKREAAQEGLIRLPYGNMRINVVIALLGLSLALGGVLPDIMPLAVSGAALCAAGFIHITVQLSNKKRRSVVIYNMGVMSYNTGKYNKAAKRFDKALSLDGKNELALRAAEKIKETERYSRIKQG